MAGDKDMNIDSFGNKALIYKFTSPSGKSYIGQSINFKERYKKYKSNNGCIGFAFSKAINKYNGIQNFTFELLCIFNREDDISITKSKLDAIEKFYIKLFDSFGKNGYNLTIGGKGSYKREVSEYTRRLLSLSNKGKNTKLFKELVNTKCIGCCLIFNIPLHEFNRRSKNINGIFCSKKCSYKMLHKEFKPCLDY